jgi:hypothetical protein
VEEPTNEELGIRPYTGWRMLLAWTCMLSISIGFWGCIGWLVLK